MKTPQIAKRDEIPVIALDMDGVLRDFSGAMCRLAVQVSARRFPYHWSYVNTWGMGDDFDMLFGIIKNDYEWWLGLELLPGTLPIPFKVDCYITHSPVPDWVNKAWLKLNGLPDAEVIQVKLTPDKITVCQQRGVTVLVDDKPETVRDAIHYGIAGLLFDAPYNQEANLPRIKSLAELRILGDKQIGRHEVYR